MTFNDGGTARAIPQEAARLYQFVAEKGIPAAMGDWGLCLLQGKGTGINYERGANLLYAAAVNGYPT